MAGSEARCRLQTPPSALGQWLSHPGGALDLLVWLGKRSQRVVPACDPTPGLLQCLPGLLWAGSQEQAAEEHLK